MNLFNPLAILTFFTLIFSANTAFANTSPATDIVGCMGAGPVCVDSNTQHEYALLQATKHALAVRGSGRYDIIIQSDAVDTVTHYQYSFSTDHMIDQGQDVADSKPVVSLISVQLLTGEAALQAKELVSSETATARFKQKYLNKSGKYPKNSGQFTIDAENFCGIGPEQQASSKSFFDTCYAALQESGLWDKPTVNSDTNVAVAQVKQNSIQLGRPIFFVTDEGYRLTIYPNKDGSADAVSFWVPPTTHIAVSKGGDLDLKALTDGAVTGGYQFKPESGRFVAMVAARTGLMAWQQLSAMIDDGLSCNYCRVTTQDLPPIK